MRWAMTLPEGPEAGLALGRSPRQSNAGRPPLRLKGRSRGRSPRVLRSAPFAAVRGAGHCRPASRRNTGMLRDGNGEISWAELSLFAADLRDRLISHNLGNPGDFDRALDRVRPALEALARQGGDPRFALGVLVSARWRRLRAPGKHFPRWIRTLERLSVADELHRLVHGAQNPRGQLKAAVDDTLQFLRGFVWQDEGIFESTTTRRTEENARWASRRSDEALAVLAWHVRAGTTARRTDLILLASLVEAFDLIRSRSGETPPVEAVKQRLKRIKGDYYQKFVIPRRRSEFHTNHCFVAWQLQQGVLQRCGTACYPNSPPEDWWERHLIRVPEEHSRKTGVDPPSADP